MYTLTDTPLAGCRESLKNNPISTSKGLLLNIPILKKSFMIMILEKKEHLLILPKTSACDGSQINPPDCSFKTVAHLKLGEEPGENPLR